MKKKILSTMLIICILVTSVQIRSYAAEIKKGCMDGKISLGVSCKESDTITLKCDDDSGFKYEYSSYTSIQLGGLSSYTKYYTLTFTTTGQKSVSVYVNNISKGVVKYTVYQSHQWDNGKKEKCTIIYTCENCGETKKGETEHEYEVWMKRDATCTSDGYINYKCKNCSDTYKETIKKLGHDYQVKKVVDPTCKAKGYTEYKCSRCSSTKKDNETKIINHDYKEVSRTDATCTKKGEIKYKCSMCNAVKTETLPIIPHHYVAVKTVPVSCVKDGYTTYKCDICNKETYNGDFIFSNGNHNYGEWETTEPTALKDGKKERTCITCGAKEEELLESLEPFIKVSKNKIKIKHGKTYKIKNVKLAYGDKITHYETSKKKIATVNKNGKIKAKRKGETRITIVAKSGIEKDIRVVVK